jgi:hypothetical protein
VSSPSPAVPGTQRSACLARGRAVNAIEKAAVVIGAMQTLCPSGRAARLTTLPEQAWTFPHGGSAGEARDLPGPLRAHLRLPSLAGR